MLFKKNGIENYICLINKIILNKTIKEEIIKKINYFNKNGEIVLDGNNLYARSKKEKDFMELKYENNYFLCNYTEWDFAKFVNISQKDLKNKFTKLEKKEKIEYKSKDDNMTKIEELEEIYNADKKLTFESKFIKDILYKTNDKGIEYMNDHYFTNYFDLNKKWYISNGSVINYRLSKSFMNKHSEIEERYSICPETYFDGFVTHYNFVELEQELFKEFMSGNISIEEVLEKIDMKEYQKMLIKNFNKINVM